MIPYPERDEEQLAEGGFGRTVGWVDVQKKNKV